MPEETITVTRRSMLNLMQNIVLHSRMSEPAMRIAIRDIFEGDKLTQEELDELLFHTVDPYTVELLVKAGARVNLGNGVRAAVHNMAWYGYERLEALKKVVELGADPNAIDHRGKTPLDHTLCFEDRKEAAEFLRERGGKTFAELLEVWKSNNR